MEGKCELLPDGGKLVSVCLHKRKTSYTIELIVNLDDGERRRWNSAAIKYPKSNKNRRDWDAELKFFEDWWPFNGGSIAPHLRDFRHAIEAEEAAARENRPRDCHASSTAEYMHAPSAGWSAQSAGRPSGCVGSKTLREKLQAYKTAVTDGRLHDAQLALRDLPHAMRQAAQGMEKQIEGWKPAFLLRQRNKGVHRKEALRKLRKAKNQWEKAALQTEACRKGWEEAVTYCRAVEKECLGAAAVHSTGLEVCMCKLRLL